MGGGGEAFSLCRGMASATLVLPSPTPSDEVRDAVPQLGPADEGGGYGGGVYDHEDDADVDGGP